MDVINFSGLMGSGKTTIARELSLKLRNKYKNVLKLEETISKAIVEELLKQFYSSYNCDVNYQLQKYFVNDTLAKITQINNLYSESTHSIIVLDTNITFSQKAYIKASYECGFLTHYQSTELLSELSSITLNKSINIINYHIRDENYDIIIERLRGRKTPETLSFDNNSLKSSFTYLMGELSSLYDEYKLSNKCLTVINSNSTPKKDIYDFLLSNIETKLKLNI